MKERKQINLQLSVMKTFKHCITNIIATGYYVEGPCFKRSPKDIITWSSFKLLKITEIIKHYLIILLI